MYSSTIELLDFISPMLRPGVVLYWDDWKDPRDTHRRGWGEHQAWHDWLVKHPDVAAETIEVNAVEQRFMVISAANGQQLTKPSLTDIRYRAFELSLRPSEGAPPSDGEIFVALCKRQLRKLPGIKAIASRDR
jgi:hypothetical protein